MSRSAVLYGLIVTAIAAATSLFLTTIFAIPSEGLPIRVILGVLITVAELTFVVNRQRRSRPSANITLAEAALSGVFILAATLGLSRWVEYTLTRSTVASDFVQDYLAAYALRHGNDIFGPPVRALGMAMLQLHKLDNYHPPFNALLFLPFSFVHYPWAFILWNFLSLLMYVGLVLLLLRSYGLLDFRWLRLSSVLLLWEPFTSSIFLGQLSIALSFGIIVSHFLLRTRRDRLAGFFLGLATLVKLYPGLMLFYLVSQRRWRCAGAFVTTFFAGLLLMIFTIRSETLMAYVLTIIPEQTRFFASYPLNISIGSGVRTLFEPTLFSLPPIWAPEAGRIAIVVISGLLVGGVSLFSYFHNDDKYSDNLFALFCITMLLVSPITWYHSCVLLLLPLALLTRSLVLHETHASTATVLWILILCGVPNQDLIDGLIAFNSSDELPWYMILGARTGLFALVLLYWIFWKRLASDAGYASVGNLLDSLRLRLLHPRVFQ